MSINKFSDVQARLQAINLKLRDLDIYIIYNPPGNWVTKTLWQHIFQNITEKQVVICGDFNFSTPLPHQQIHPNSQIYTFLMLMQSMDMNKLNDGTPTRLGIAGQRDTQPDLTFANSNLFPLTSWTVLVDPMGSDHLPIQISINENLHRIRNIHRTRLNIYNINWEQYQNSIEEDIQGIAVGKCGLQIYTALTSAIYKFLNIHHPYKRHNTTPKVGKPSWWDAECSKTIAQRRLALYTFKRIKNFQNYIKLCKQQAITKRLLNTKKRNSWKLFCNQLTQLTPKAMWNNIKWFTNKQKSNSYENIMYDVELKVLHQLQ